MLSMFFLRTFPLQHGLGENRPSARFAFDTGNQSNASRVNSSATVGTEPDSTQRYSMDVNALTYAANPHTYGPPKMTENHGVPGSNPGPAT